LGLRRPPWSSQLISSDKPRVGVKEHKAPVVSAHKVLGNDRVEGDFGNGVGSVINEKHLISSQKRAPPY
jgi:hypothetical protein